ncbi:RCC1 domain-containing protein [Leucobacter sp. HY1910]
MMLRNVLRGLLAVSVVLGLVGVGSVAKAVPDPASGPVTGGTEVTIEPPPGVTFTQVSAGYLHSVARAEDGTAYAWGSNGNGQLGDGTNTGSNVPVPVEMPDGVTFTQVSAGVSHSVALALDGTAYTWGYNGSGQLGDSTTTNRNVPVLVEMPAGVTFTQVSAGNSYSVALAADGTAYAWGSNGSGQLGDSTATNRNVPVLVEMPAGVTFTQVSAGGSHSVAVAEGGAAYAWGNNFSGQLGDGTNTSSTVPVPKPVQMPAGVTFTQVSAGYWHSVAVAEGGAAYAWGNNLSAQLGDGTNTSSTVPVPVELPAGVTFKQVSAGGSHSVAVAGDGAAYAWGSSVFGQLGDATNTGSNVPVQVEFPAGVTFKQVSAGGSHSVAVAGDGTAYAWGSNSSGQLGDGTFVNRNVPVRVLTQTTVTGVSFDRISATDLVDNGDGSWTATTPPHTAGPVDVVVSWELNGVAQPDIAYAGAFTYVAPDVAPTVTDPVDQSVTAGDDATFTVDTTGAPEPSLLWEFSADDGATWDAVTVTDGTVSSDGKALTVAATEALSGTQYRATAENSAGSVTSAAATLTVTSASVKPPVTDPVTPPATDPMVPPVVDSVGAKDLAHTGSDPASSIAAAVLLVLVGVGLVLASRRKQA